MVVQRAQRNFSGVDRGLAQRAPKHFFHGNQTVLAVEKQHSKNFMWAVPQLQLQVVFHSLRAAQHFTLTQLLRRGTFGQFHHCQYFRTLGRAEPLDAGQVLAAGVKQASKAIKALQRGLCHLQDAAASQTCAQQNGQQLGIRQGANTACLQLFTGAGIGWQIFQRHAPHADSGINRRQGRGGIPSFLQ